MKNNVLPFVVLTLGLSSCAVPAAFNPLDLKVAQPTGANSPNLAWARNDGQLISDSPKLTAQARADISECLATIPPVKTPQGVTGVACMNKRGYHVREIP
jgi:hypothetical protein